MLDLRDLECLVALARHRHFAKAAAQCGLSQPAFSMRIRHLEERLDTQIVKRGNRYQGLTAEGETILRHARSIVDDVRGLEEEVRAAKGEVIGSLVLGVVPTAAAYGAQVANWLQQSHPGIRLKIETATSLAIQQGVDDGMFDAGITYTEGVSADILRAEELYQERYVLLLPEALAGERADVTWIEASRIPLILLEQEMQNRRIIDEVFRQVGAVPQVVAETNGFMAAVVMTVEGMGATVIPHVLLDTLGSFGNTRFLPLVDPVVEKSVSLVTPRRDKVIPVLEALRETIVPIAS